MYLEHFGLDQPPFRITPNAAFFYAGANRGPTLEALLFSVLHGEGIVKVSGEVGTGKTMLCRMLLANLPAEADSVYLANPTLNPDDLLRLVAEELKIPAAAGNSGVLLLEIQQALIARFAAGRRVVALVDEAHAMPRASLEQIRLLSNLETGDHKLLQIVLFGQPELDDILAQREMRQLRDRITQHFRLAPLKFADVERYLDFRLRKAGYRGPRLFTSASSRRIARASQGLSRRVNILADKSLLAAFARGSHQIRSRDVAAAIRDSEYPVPRSWWRWAGAALLLGSVTAAGTAWHGGWHPARLHDPAGAPQAAPAAPLAGANAEPAPAAPPETPQPAPAIAAPPSEAPGPAHPALGPLAAALQTGTPRWVVETPADHWFIQLDTVDGARPESVEQRLAQLPATIDRDRLRVYLRDLGWGTRVGIIYGDFASREAALAALAGMPAELRSAGAYPRQVAGLK